MMKSGDLPLQDVEEATGMKPSRASVAKALRILYREHHPLGRGLRQT